MEKLKSLPLSCLMTFIYPDLYPVHGRIDYENDSWPHPLHLSYANFERNGVYLLDTFDSLYLYICKSVNPEWLSEVFGVSQWQQIPDDGDRDASSRRSSVSDAGLALIPLPDLSNHTSRGLRAFIECLMDSRPFRPHVFILRYAHVLYNRMIIINILFFLFTGKTVA